MAGILEFPHCRLPTTTMPSLPTAFASAARLDSLDTLERFRTALAQGVSEREAAAALGIARSTLRDRKARVDALDADPLARAFFSSSVGLSVLHRLLCALHVAFPLHTPVGLHAVSLFLRLSGLDVFLGASHGAQFAFSAALQRQTALFGQHQTKLLGARMPERAITLLQDETFHPTPLFVAIEPLSGFVLVESYGPACDAPTWDALVKGALTDLPRVAVVQVCADGGRALAAHVAHQKGVWLSPDLFHVLHDLVAVVLPALQTTARHASGAQQVVAQLRCQQAQEALTAFSEAYHPFDVHTGQARCADQVQRELHAALDRLGELVLAAETPTTTWDAIGKSRRAIPQMAATIAFVHEESRRCMESLDTSSEVKTLVRERLLPALYLQRVAAKTRSCQAREPFEQTAEALLSPLRAEGSVWQQQTAEQRSWWQDVTQACADLFQRSSSAAEGRNHRLRLMHDAVTELGEMRLRAFTVVQNFVVERRGQTTAERFFGERPDDLMGWLLERVPLPPRAGKRRPAQVKANLLN